MIVSFLGNHQGTSEKKETTGERRDGQQQTKTTHLQSNRGRQ